MKQAKLPKFELNNYNNVYLPDEDTFLLMDAILNFPPSSHPSKTLEVGCGYGCVGVQIASQFNTVPTLIDINVLALENAKNTFKLNNLEANFVQSDLFDQVSGQFDLIAFNPPYVPGDFGEGLDVALTGGVRGREVIDRFLGLVKSKCLLGAVVYLVTIEANGVQEIIEEFQRQGFTAEVIMQKRLQSEFLKIIRAELMN